MWPDAGESKVKCELIAAFFFVLDAHLCHWSEKINGSFNQYAVF